MDDRLAYRRAEPRHALAEPGRHAAAMEREIGAAGTCGHGKETSGDVLLMF
jgi:hypothetical protein